MSFRLVTFVVRKQNSTEVGADIYFRFCICTFVLFPDLGDKRYKTYSEQKSMKTLKGEDFLLYLSRNPDGEEYSER